MKKFWTFLGAAAAAAALVPYRVEEDVLTGRKIYKALLWQATRTPQEDGGKKVAVTFGPSFASKIEDDDIVTEDDFDDEDVAGEPIVEISLTVSRAPDEPETEAEPEAETEPEPVPET